MINNLRKISAVLSIFAVTSAAQAANVDATFTFGWGGDRSLTGSIQGTDLNNDGILRRNEVTSIFESLSGHSVLSSLYDIGDINIAAETWTPNGISWDGYPNTAFMTFDNRNWSCTTYNGCGVTFTSFNDTNGVPEPASLALLGLGLAGLAFSRRKTR